MLVVEWPDEEWDDEATLAADRAATVAAATVVAAASPADAPRRPVLPPADAGTGTSWASVPLLIPGAAQPSKTYTDLLFRASCRSIRVRNGLLLLFPSCRRAALGERRAILDKRKCTWRVELMG